MARAFPLTAPDGRIYAYVCGRCHHIGQAGERLIELDGPDEQIVESSKTLAAHCCTCERCGAEIGKPAFFEPRVCASCRPAYDAENIARIAKSAAGVSAYVKAREKTLSKALDAAAALTLEHLMGEISEAYCAAGWLSNLEHSLWRMLQGDSRDFGMGEVTDQEIAQLRQLHERCGGWWRWGDDVVGGPVFVTTTEWIPIHEAHCRELEAWLRSQQGAPETDSTTTEAC